MSPTFFPLWLGSVPAQSRWFVRLAARLVSTTLLALAGAYQAFGQDTVPFAIASPLKEKGDLSAQMVEGIDRFLMHETDRALADRPKLWHRDVTSRERYEESIAPNRDRFRRAIGAVDRRLPVTALEYFGNAPGGSAKIAESDRFTVYAVRWPVFEEVHGEGLLLQPKGPVLARVVAIPDADQTPEMLAGLRQGVAPQSQFARRLAENGCQVLVPTMISRDDTWSGNSELGRFTNQPHREWIYRQAFELGRHIIGYEVAKMLSAVDWFAKENLAGDGRRVKIGIAGYGEGGLIAFYTAALDPRIDAALVSGYFGPRQRVWEEPIYRNIFGLLKEFGDAEIASLIAPRGLIVEHSEWPKVDGPPPRRQGRSGAAPGKLVTPERVAIETELERARGFFPSSFKFEPELIYANEGQTAQVGSANALASFLERLAINNRLIEVGSAALADARTDFDPADRQKEQVEELVRHTQHLLVISDRLRDDFFWNKTKPNSTSNWPVVCQEFKNKLWDEVIGRFEKPSVDANVRARKFQETASWTAYEVMLDVWPDVYAWGLLLVPKDIKPGEHRPVVVCQHGLEGLPEHTVSDDPKGPGYGAYKAFAARLAERGFITFAPHNPYRGNDKFRVLQRKANPLGKSLFSVILGQHDRILDWLSGLPFVDANRIGFYGLSYGGKTAIRVPALLDRYCLSICSADFNDWVKKNATVESPYSYMFMGEYELPEFDLGETFNYAEMAALIAPRPFMVERGHHDGVAPDEWVAYEYAKVRRCYAELGIPERTRIEFFNGPHTINGIGTFEFLRTHLRWPEK